MSIIWNIVKVEVLSSFKNNTNVVNKLHWNLIANKNGKSASVLGSTEVSFNPDLEFTAFDQLEEQQVVTWLKQSLGQEVVFTHEENVLKMLSDLTNLPSIIDVPWSK
jgi:hypothetical protein